MATFYVDSAWGGPFNGTESQPFATVASGTLGENDWLVRAGSVVAMGATQLSSGNNTTIRKLGAGPDPEFTFTGNGLNCSTASGAVVVEDIKLTRLSTQGGTGANFTQMSGGSASATLRRCTLTNWTDSIQATAAASWKSRTAPSLGRARPTAFAAGRT